MLLVFFFFPLFVCYIWVMQKPEMEIPVVQNNNNKTPKERFLSPFKGPRKRQDKNFSTIIALSQPYSPEKQTNKKTLFPINRGWVGSLDSHFKRDKEGSLPSLLGDIREGLTGSQGFHCYVVVTGPPQEVSVEATCGTQIRHTCHSQPRWHQWKLSVAGMFLLISCEEELFPHPASQWKLDFSST